jgi:2-dehydropantoate 2-reductase
METRPFRQNVVFGAGALGSWLGARLAPPAVLVARGEHARAMRESGLRLAGVENAVVPVAVADACPPLEADALLLLTVKVIDLAAAARAVRDRLREDTVVAVVANGFAPQEILGEALGRPVVRVVAEFGATMDGPGRVSAWGGRALLLHGVREDRVAAALAPTGLRVERIDDLARHSWEKLALNCVANPLAGLTGRRNCDLADDDLADLRLAVTREVMEVAARDGVDLPDELPERIDLVLARSRNLNSMAQDLARGRPTEIEHLNGFVARQAEAFGFDAPLNRWLAALIRLREGKSE